MIIRLHTWSAAKPLLSYKYVQSGPEINGKHILHTQIEIEISSIYESIYCLLLTLIQNVFVDGQGFI